ncbi:hypothetical protein ACMZ6Y_05160 [Streptococcus pluranimalium]|uniref:hypothetical protein n=1 Tax=Streptococcus hyovaginalis TaxID=149015 RepID=UPI002A8406C0|nr:hypothetical protein [Streptococcus hyovaginalis]MDY4511540.1 hypothetical protein [Streptococcus hyovaginalis]
MLTEDTLTAVEDCLSQVEAALQAQKMDVVAIQSGNYCSLYGPWVKPNGESITFNASTFCQGGGQMSYKKDFLGGLMFGFILPSSGQVFFSAGVTFENTENTTDRLFGVDVTGPGTDYH